MQGTFKFAAALAVAVAVGLAGAAFAQADAVKNRQAQMKVIGGSMGQLGKFAKGEEPYDAAKAKAAADAIAATGKTVFAHFVPGSHMGAAGAGENWAKKDIWDNKAKFDDAAKALNEQAVKLAAVAGTGKDPMAAQMAELGKTCAGCHQPFRQPK